MVGNSGRYSKFQQRLRNIYLSWLMKRKQKKSIQDKFVEDKVEEIRKEFSVSEKNSVVKEKVMGIKVIQDNYINVKNREKRSIPVKQDNAVGIKRDKAIEKNIGDNKVFVSNTVSKKVKNNKSNNVCFTISRKNKISKAKNTDSIVSKRIFDNKDIDLSKVELINKLKNKFIEKEAELDVLESELFFISNVIDNSLDCSEIKELKKKIREIIEEINNIIEQYNLYNKNSDLSCIVGLDDNYLIDDIIDYRNLLDSRKDRQKFVKEYKLLDEFKSLYLKLETVKAEVNKVNKTSEEVINKYDIRDEKYDQVKMNLLNIKGLNEEYLNEIKKQNESLDKLMKKLSVIDSQEVVVKKLVGLSDLLVQGFKFLGLKLLSPLSGFIPSIAGETIVTRNMIKNIYKSMHEESVSQMYYSAVDYNSELNVKINDINYTEVLVNDTLKDLKRVKEDFFTIYDINIPGYDDTLKSINKMEDIIYKNQCKVKIVKDKLKLSKKINEDKMIKVRKLNDDRR